MNKQTVASFFEFRLVKKVFSNFKDYILVMLKGMGLGLVFLVLIFVLVGIPGVIFTQRIFMADFYRRNIK